MDLTPLNAISPVDGRYRRSTKPLSRYFSEGALIRYRVRVEVEYFIALCRIPLPQLAGVNTEKLEALRRLVDQFGEAEARQVKEIEAVTNHDVKAVEYFLKERFESLGLGAVSEFVHFGLTSQDVNNTAAPLSMKEACAEVVGPALERLVEMLERKAAAWENVPMLARTHGQPASPTRLGKEIRVFSTRMREQLRLLEAVPFAAKFGGATGNFNAHCVAYPEVNWNAFADRLVNEVLGLHRSQVTTQIEHYDHLAAFCDGLKRINTILLDFSRDIWTYISLDYFKQAIHEGEVGSSAMPHKINPIDFENAEGNLGVANALFEHLAAKLPVSRLQRDLTDSTVLRNIGVPLAHTLIAVRSLMKGADRLLLNEDRIREDLEDNWTVLAEAIQTVLRREGYPQPYEALKALTRTHKKIGEEDIRKFIDQLDIPESVKEELHRIKPWTYTGM